MEYLQLVDVLYLHQQIVAATGGSPGLRDRGILESALAQPRMTFAGVDLYATVPEKAAAICFSLVLNHPFVDGNKRIGYAAMRLFLDVNGWLLNAKIDDAEQTMLALAAGQIPRKEFTQWVSARSSQV
jgi:death-on-curing protein